LKAGKKRQRGNLFHRASSLTGNDAFFSTGCRG
jgi:hypothetical protein